MKNRLIDIFKRPVTTVLIVINAIVFLFTYSNENYYVYHGGLNYDLVIENGEWYRFITCMFLHSGFQHILMNVVSLAFCGFSLEDKIGSLRTGVIYFGSGLCGGVLSVVINWLMARSVISVGASGAVYGLLAAYAVNQALEEGKPVWKSFGIVAIYVIGTYSVGVDFLGHFGGILGGAALSLLLLRKR